MTQPSQVVLFLTEIKQLIAKHEFSFVERLKNIQTMTNHGWSMDTVVNMLMNLTPGNYCDGPNPDVDYPGESVWIFGIDIPDENVEIYLKIKLKRSPLETVVIISFHEAERAMIYPFA